MTKSKVKYQLADAQNNGDLDEQFKIGLRNEGIYFDIDISPTSPRKRNLFYSGDQSNEALNNENVIIEEEIDSPTFNGYD